MIVPVCQTLTVIILYLTDMDPFAIFISVSRKYHFPKIAYIILHTARFALIAMISQILACNVRFLFILLFTQAVPLLALIQIINEIKLDRKSVRLYRQLQVERALIRDTEKIGSSLILALGALLLIVSINSATLGMRLNNFVIFAVSVFVLVVLVIGFGITFSVCCSINENSVKALTRWQRQLQSVMLGRKYYRCLLLSLRALFCPAGDLGILDKSIKCNYSSAVLLYSVNLMIMLKQVK